MFQAEVTAQRLVVWQSTTWLVRWFDEAGVEEFLGDNGHNEGVILLC